MYESPASILRERGSRVLSFLERSLTPATRQLEKLEDKDLEDPVDPAEAPEKVDGSVVQEQDQDTNQEREITINGEVVRIGQARVRFADFKGYKT